MTAPTHRPRLRSTTRRVPTRATCTSCMRTTTTTTAPTSWRSGASTAGSRSPRRSRSTGRPGLDRAQWFPWVTVDTTTGRVCVLYYDQGIAASGDLSETTVQYSDDGGLTWNEPMPLTDRPFHAAYGNDTGQPNIGDYNQAVAQNGELFATWSGNPPLVLFTNGQP